MVQKTGGEMLEILGAGFPRTGTRTLADALRIMKYNTIHHPEMPLFPTGAGIKLPDTDAILDCPAVLYWEEIVERYNPKVILTTREPNDWWESMKAHANTIRTGANMEHIQYSDALHGLLFGCAAPNEYWWKRRYEEHNEAVRRTIPAGRLLELDIVAGDKWNKLCPFLGEDTSKAEWPWRNRRQRDSDGER